MDATLYLDAAEAAEHLIGAPRVAERWTRPSALEGYTVGALAGHLARAVLPVESYLDAPVLDTTEVDAAGYFARVLADHDPVTSELHAAVRERSRGTAGAGPAALSDEVGHARTALAHRLAEERGDRWVAVVDGIVLRLDSYLDTRLVELVVHLDDLALSVGLPWATGVPDAASERVAAVLARLACRRQGPIEVVRGLARRERHPAPVRAL